MKACDFFGFTGTLKDSAQDLIGARSVLIALCVIEMILATRTWLSLSQGVRSIIIMMRITHGLQNLNLNEDNAILPRMHNGEGAREVEWLRFILILRKRTTVQLIRKTFCCRPHGSLKNRHAKFLNWLESFCKNIFFLYLCGICDSLN